MLSWMTTTTLGKWIATILVSMVPIIELRGGIPYGVGFGLPYWQAFAASFIGNMMPVPFIILFLRKIFHVLKKGAKTGRIVGRLEKKAHLKGKRVTKYRRLGLFILVAIPLPGTGAWTGALVASVFDIRLRDALPVIAAGLVTAGFIVLMITHGVVQMI